MNQLDEAIRTFTPRDDLWLPLERLFEQAFAGPDPRIYYHAIFALFARFPEEDGAGVFWSAVHGMEAVDGYDELLLQAFLRQPSLMTKIMIRRIGNSGQTHLGKTPIATLISSEA